MKNKPSFSIKNILISSIAAIVVLNLFCMLYYNVPIHMDCEDGVTDYVWEKNKRYIQLNEGIGYGITNNEGYMDQDDYYGETIDILLLGSSHIQGISVAQSRNISSLMQDMFRKNVYNLAIAGHNFKVCVSNLQAALEKYHPDTVIIETNKLSFTVEETEAMLSGDIPEIASENEGIIGFLQRSPFLRIAYSQFQNFISKETDKKKEKDYANDDDINAVLQLIHSICETYECRAVIFYHPTLILDYNGSLKINTDEKTEIWSKLSKDNGIVYLDMSEKYMDEYRDSGILPYGFINTAIGTGHLNKNGHRMIAEELFRILKGAD